MKGLRLSGALMLGMAAVVAGGAEAWALDEKVEQDLYGAVNRVTMIKQEIDDCGAACQSTMFPGVSDYLGRLLDDAHKEMTEAEAQQYIAALEDAAVAAPLLTGLKAQQTAAQMKSTVSYVATESVAAETVDDALVMSEDAEKKEVVAETKPVTVVKEVSPKTTVKVEKVETEKEIASVEVEAENKAEDVEVEVPATGVAEEDREVNAKVLIVAGVAVVVATIGTTLLIIRMKRNV